MLYPGATLEGGSAQEVETGKHRGLNPWLSQEICLFASWVDEYRSGSEPGSPRGQPRGVVVATGVYSAWVNREYKLDKRIYRKFVPVATAPGSVFVGPRQEGSKTSVLAE